jgi:very-short-patch-repair endonuclease
MCSTTQPAVRSLRELRGAGLGRGAVTAGLRDGSLVRLRRGVYASDGACDAIRRAAEHGGSLACVSAARHLGLWVCGQEEEEEQVHVWLRAHGRAYAHDDCACIGHWDAAGAKNVFAIPSVPRVLRQILLCRGVEDFFVALESARRQRRISRRGLTWLRAHTNDAGRDAIAFSRSDADSGLESLLRWRLRPYGLAIRTQVRLPSVGVVDFLIGERLIIEVDGVVNHDGESHRHKDLVRDANAAAWGFVTLRFDYAMVVHDWETVELAILGAIDRGLDRA